LAEAQYVYSGGQTSYSRFIGAIVITLLLLALQYGVARLSRLSGRWYAFTFFPSFLILAFITSLNRQVIESFSLGQWVWALPLLIIVFIISITKLRHKMVGKSIDSGDYSFSRYLWPNFLEMFIMMVLCGANSSSGDVYLYELKAERLLLEGNYVEASKVGEYSQAVSPRLNELRMYALARQGQLGEKLFDYPQPYGNESLMQMDDTVSRLHRFTCKDIQKEFGAWANVSVKTLDSYLDLLKKNSSTRNNPLLADYVLCSQLLQRNLRGFIRSVRQYYDLSSPQYVLHLPKSYREALLLQARNIGRDSLHSFADTLMLANYHRYRGVLESDTADIVKKNILRRDFGHTFWWYMDQNDI